MDENEELVGQGNGALNRKTMREKRHSRRVVISSVVFVILAVVAVFLFCGGDEWVNRQSVAIGDWLKERDYEPSEEIVSLRNSLELTDKGKRVFAATDPTLEKEASFNEKCTFRDVGGYVLGCYVSDPGKIYIYRVDTEELDGIHEATAAHELLHAVWARMSEGERKELMEEMERFRQDNVEILGEELAMYDEGKWQDELHSRIGVEFAELPEKLEEHYEKYFSDRAKIVALYQGYKGTYDGIKVRADELQTEIDGIKAEIEDLKNQITDERKSYQERLNAYRTAVSGFNECARSHGCYSDSEFEVKANELNREGSNINYLREAVNTKVRAHNAKIEELNLKVDEYNQNALHLQQLNDKMNSQVEVIDEKE